MDIRGAYDTEPVALTSVLTAAVVATINVLAIIFNWSTDITGGLNIAAAAWVAVAGWLVRAKVSPVAVITQGNVPG